MITSENPNHDCGAAGERRQAVDGGKGGEDRGRAPARYPTEQKNILIADLAFTAHYFLAIVWFSPTMKASTLRPTGSSLPGSSSIKVSRILVSTFSVR